MGDIRGKSRWNADKPAGMRRLELQVKLVGKAERRKPASLPDPLGTLRKTRFQHRHDPLTSRTGTAGPAAARRPGGG